MPATSTVTSRYWARPDFNGPPLIIELRDGAAGVDVRTPYDTDTQVSYRKYGAPCWATVCCGPSAFLPEVPAQHAVNESLARRAR